jgi:transposase
MRQAENLSMSSTRFEQDKTIVAVVEMSQASWLVAGIVPGIEWHPLKKLGADEEALLRLLRRWQEEAAKAGCTITRIASPLRQGATAFGWHAGCGRVASRRTSSTN